MLRAGNAPLVSGPAYLRKNRRSAPALLHFEPGYVVEQRRARDFTKMRFNDLALSIYEQGSR